MRQELDLYDSVMEDCGMRALQPPFSLQRQDIIDETFVTTRLLAK